MYGCTCVAEHVEGEGGGQERRARYTGEGRKLAREAVGVSKAEAMAFHVEGSHVAYV